MFVTGFVLGFWNILSFRTG